MSAHHTIRPVALALIWTALFTLPGVLAADPPAPPPGGGSANSQGRGTPARGRNTPPGLAVASFVGHRAPDQPISLTLTLDLRDHAGVDALLQAQQDPDSPLYHQWITPEEFQERFGPAAYDLQAAKDFLMIQGFTNISQPTSTQISANGTVALAEQALQVQINDYALHGRSVFANDRDPVLPQYLASKIVHIGGLDDLTEVHPHHGPVTRLDPAYELSGNVYILPRDNQVSYGQKAGYFDLGKKGSSGAELAIASSWDIALADVNDQLTRQGGAAAGYNALTTAASGPHTTSSTCVPGTGVGTGCTYVVNGGVNDSLETIWDLSLASSIANDNHFGVYLAETPTPAAFSVLYQYLADRAGTIKVVTHSWGACLSVMDPAVVRADENAFAQAAAGGQAWFVASGDFGSNDCNGNGGINPDVSYPAASAYVTAVGGSEENLNAAGTFGADGWVTGYPPNGEGACYNGGGGEATAGILGPRPSWQFGTGVTGTYRLVPDISMHYGMCLLPGAGKSYLVRLGANVYGASGTSGTAPQWAAFWAVANQVVGTNLGHAAPTLFRILRNEGGTTYANSFHDINTGNNGAYPAGAGFDSATGIGTPKFNALYPALQTLFAPAASGCFTDTTQGDFQAGTATAVNTTASPGNVKLGIVSGGEGPNTQNTNVNTGGGFWTDTSVWMGQTFTPTATGTLTRVDLAIYCSGCSGFNPDITVEVRGTSGGLPTAAVLASATIPGFASPVGPVYYTATFASPASVSSGTTYALVAHPTANRAAGLYVLLANPGNVYAGGQGVLSNNSGASWGSLGAPDMGFKTFVTTLPTYAASGNVISDVNDANPSGSGTPHVSSLTWTGSAPANTTLRFQLATSNNPAGPFTFIGPDGTVSTYFTTTPASPAGELFQGRYFKWKAFLSTTNSAATPILNDVTVCYNNTCAGLPSAPVASSNSPVCQGGTLELHATPVAGATYFWTGPNGFTSTVPNPVIPEVPIQGMGTYNVRTTIGACSSAMVPTSVTVIETSGPCNDLNACTQSDYCQGGTCTGSNPVVCPSDQCHNAGTCNPASGICSAMTTRYNQACNDGDPCTSNDSCGLRLVQNFDQAPGSSIPAPWTTSLLAGAGGDLPWRIDPGTPHTPALSAFAIDPEHTTDKVLDSPTFTVTASPNPALVTFYQRFQTEFTYDGGVLEISINSGPFTDIVAAGGSFVTGGYTATIDPLEGSPIAGRQAWTGTSAGYPNFQPTVVSLPPAASGQSTRLRWRFVSDYIVPSTGQWIDTIGIVDDFPAMTCVGQPSSVPQEVGTILAAPDKANYTFPPAPGAESYDAVRGLVTFLPVGPGALDEACGHFGSPAIFDTTPPPVGNAFWYIARGRNSCAVGPWGYQSNGTPEVTTTCP